MNGALLGFESLSFFAAVVGVITSVVTLTGSGGFSRLGFHKLCRDNDIILVHFECSNAIAVHIQSGVSVARNQRRILFQHIICLVLIRLKSNSNARTFFNFTGRVNSSSTIGYLASYGMSSLCKYGLNNNIIVRHGEAIRAIGQCQCRCG